MASWTASVTSGSTPSEAYRRSNPSRIPATSPSSMARMEGTGASSAVGSFASAPAIASSMIAASATLRVIGPMWSSDPASSSTP